jgi:UDP-N-acetylglucosamine 2-epimerase (non-hydrolysing)
MTARNKIKIISVVGARPNFMKIAPFISAIKSFNNSRDSNHPSKPINHLLVHTGQHYNVQMSDAFFRDLNIPSPDFNLEVGSGSHAVQTAEIMVRFEKICLQEKPDWIVVVGDVNSTMACTLVASKLGIKVAHVEAGLRSFDKTMPEEINRLVTDALADLLLTPSKDADKNLLHEGVSKEKIKLVGNIMIDTLLTNVEKARQLRPHMKYDLREKEFVFVTLHRPSNVDHKQSLSVIMRHLIALSKKVSVIFPMHPRTRKNLIAFGLQERISHSGKMIITDPLGYHETIGLVDKSKFVLTDSGGLQEETTALGVPCLTLRPNTERPITISHGTNQLTSLSSLEDDLAGLMSGNDKKGRIPPLWDGHTADRIVEILANG